MASPIGGQAVLEGVMMRGATNWSVAVRKPNGAIAQVQRPIESAMAKHRLLRLPIIRGVVALGESLAIGFRALAISANYAAQEETAADDEEPTTELSRGALIFAFAVAIGFAVMLFKVTPALITDFIGIQAGWFVLVEGLIRVSLFVAYLGLISLLPDLKRVFQYHAAEHKAINAYEAGEPLEPERVQRFSLIHPRSGTAGRRTLSASRSWHRCRCGEKRRVDRSVQTDARAEPARPDDGTASGALVPRVERHAEVTWKGNLARGEGRISAPSGAFSELPYSAATRVA